MDTVRSTDGTTIAYDRTGEGPPVVLVGGAFQYRAFDRRTTEIASRLASRFTVIHYDRRGRGDSGDTPPYAVEREIEDVQALIGAVGGPVSVFGMSSGAVLALDAAAHGLDIARLALYEPPFIVDDSRPPAPEDYREQLTELAAADRRGEMVELFLTEVVGVPAEYVTPMREQRMWSGFEAAAPSLVHDAHVMEGTQQGEPLPRERWAPVTIPTLVMDGGDSDPYQGDAVAALVELLPDAQRQTLAGQTHDVAPDVLVPALEQFFANEEVSP